MEQTNVTKTDKKVKEKVETKDIYKKLLAFQKLGITTEKDGTNPHFKSRYVTLNEVLAKVKKPLNEMGIIILQTPEEKGLRTKLFDTESETAVEGFLPYVEIGTAQKLGSNNTYNRRYSLITMLGLEDEDDDGNEASRPVAPRAVAPAKPVAVATKTVSQETEIDIDDLIG